MKSFLPVFVLCFFFFGGSLQAQQEYTVNGKKFRLNTAVEGPLTLLWNIVDGEYRYFSKKEESIEELKNSKQAGVYQEEYKQTLDRQTSDAPVSTEKVKLTLPSLSAFFEAYNKRKDPNYVAAKQRVQLDLRLGVFGGISNSVFTENPNNALQPVAGIDLELVDGVKLKRHALVFQYKQTFESSEYAYTASQLSLNYRFKFVKTPKFDAFVNCKFVSFTHSKKEVILNGVPGKPGMVQSVSGSDFSAPVTFGIGADYKLGKGYITFNYNDIVGLSVDSNGEFPIDFTLGYKFNL